MVCRSRLGIVSTQLPSRSEAEDGEVLLFIEQNHLMGRGRGYIDVHLCASAVLTRVPIWTYDRRLNEAGEVLGIRYKAA